MNKHDDLRRHLALTLDGLTARIAEAGEASEVTTPLRRQSYALRAAWQALDSRKGSRAYGEAIDALGRIGTGHPGRPLFRRLP